MQDESTMRICNNWLDDILGYFVELVMHREL